MELNPFESTNSLPLAKKEFNSYQDLISSISDKVNWVIVAGFKDYSGDFFILGTDDNKCFYYGVGGYGSCSFCDALQACETEQELLELRDAIKRKIRKFDSLDEFENWFNNVAQTEWYNTDDVMDFIKQATNHFPCALIWRNNK